MDAPRQPQPETTAGRLLPNPSDDELNRLLLSSAKFTPALSGKAMREMSAVWNEPSFATVRDVIGMQKVSEAALREGENFIAYEAAQRALALLGDSQVAVRLELVQNQAQALARAGAPLKAQELLNRLVGEGHRDPTTLGRLSRTYRDLGLLASAAPERRRLFAEAYRFARQGFEHKPNYYNGIQAAQAAVLLGETGESEVLVNEVERIVHRAGTQADETDDAFWRASTLAEVWLMRNDLEKARAHYAEMRGLGAQRSADVGAVARVCRMLLEAMGRNPREMDDCFQLDPVVVFSGHLFDAPDRPVPRFPHTLENEARAAIRKVLAAYTDPIGYVSLSWGSDLVFAEEMLELPRALVNVCLPADVDTSRRLAIEVPSGKHGATEARLACARFDRILERAASVKVMPKTGTDPEPEDYAYLNKVMVGMALLRARSLDRLVQPLLLWNGQANEDPGGTADFLRQWPRRDIRPILIDTNNLSAISHAT